MSINYKICQQKQKKIVPSSQYVISLRAANNAGYGMELLKDVITKRKYGD